MKNKKQETLKEMIRRIIKETNSLLSLEQAKKLAIKQSKENGNAVQHVNEIRPGQYKVEDWYDANKTVWSCEGSREI